MATKVGEGYVGISADYKTLQGQLAGLGSLLGGKFGAMGALLGNRLGEGMGKGVQSHLGQTEGAVTGLTGVLGKFGTKGGVAGAVVAATAAVGVGLYKMGSDFDAAQRTIARSTGESGRDLQNLDRAFSDVLKTVPASMGQVASAISGVQRYTGPSSKSLEGLSRQFLTLSRISGTDVKTNVEAGVRAFENWNIPAKEAPRLMDQLYRASQKSGVGFSELAQGVTHFGPQLRVMGYSFTDSTAMMAAFGKQGVNSSRVFMAMQLAAANMGKAQTSAANDVRKAQDKLAGAELAAASTTGPKHAKALQEVTKAQLELNVAQKTAAEANRGSIPAAFRETINSIKDAKTNQEALGLAVQTFGKRGALQLVDAIRSGKFNFDEMEKSIKNSNHAIADTANHTKTLGGQFGILKNSTAVALQPLSADVFQGIRRGLLNVMTALIPATNWLGKNMPGAIKHTVDAFKETEHFIDQWVRRIYEYLTPLRHTIGDIFVAWARVIRTSWDLAQPVLEAIGRTFILLYDIITGKWGAAWTQVKGILGDVGRALLRVPEMLYRLITLPFSALGAHVTDALNGFWSVLTAIPGKILRAIGNLGSLLLQAGKDLINGLLTGIQFVWNNTVVAWLNLGQKIINAVGNLTQTLLQAGKDVLTGLWNGLQWVWNNEIAGWLNIGQKIVGAVGWLGGVLVEAGKSALNGLWAGMVWFWETQVRGWLNIGQKISDAVGWLGLALWHAGSDVIGGLLGGARAAWNDAWNWFAGRGQKAADAVGNLLNALWNAGYAVIQGFINGAKKAWDDLKGFFGSIGGWVAGHKGPLDYDRRLLIPHGQAMMQGLAAGLKSQMPMLESVLSGVADTIGGVGGSLDASLSSGGTGLGGRGPSVVVQHAHFNDNLDVEQFMRQAAWVAQTQGL